MSTTKLLPCPFCGNTDITINNENPKDSSGGYFIACAACGASTNLRFACGDDPIPLLAEQWNRRATVAVPDEREAFEAFAREYGTWDIKRDDVPQLGITSYTDVAVVVAWHAWQARAELVAAQKVPTKAITAAIMRDDGGESPAFCLMVAYRSETDAISALATLAVTPTTAVPANAPKPVAYLHPSGSCATTDLWYKKARWIPLFTEQPCPSGFVPVAASVLRTLAEPGLVKRTLGKFSPHLAEQMGFTKDEFEALGALYQAFGESFDYPCQSPQTQTQADAWDAVMQAVRDYYFALDTRQHGGVAASTALDAIQKVLGLNWVQGAEASARAAIEAAKGK